MLIELFNNDHKEAEISDRSDNSYYLLIIKEFYKILFNLLEFLFN
jgi:hypothetical protein